MGKKAICAGRRMYSLSDKERSRLSKTGVVQILRIKSPSELRALSKSEEHDVRVLVSRNRAAPPDVLDALSRDKDETIIEEVAANVSTPPFVLAGIYAREGKKNGWILEQVAMNPNTPGEILARISASKDVEEGISMKAAENIRNRSRMVEESFDVIDKGFLQQVIDHSAKLAEMLEAHARKEEIKAKAIYKKAALNLRDINFVLTDLRDDMPPTYSSTVRDYSEYKLSQLKTQLEGPATPCDLDDQRFLRFWNVED